MVYYFFSCDNLGIKTDFTIRVYACACIICEYYYPYVILICVYKKLFCFKLNCFKTIF